MRYRQVTDVAVERFDNELVIFAESTRSLHRLDPVGTAIWDALGAGEDGTDFSGVVDEIVRRTDAQSGIIAGHVRDFLDELVQRGVVERIGPPSVGKLP